MPHLRHRGPQMQLFDFSICPFSEKAQKQPVHARMAKTQTPSSVSRPKLGPAGSAREKVGQKPVGFFRWIFVGTWVSAVNMLRNRKIKQLPMDFYKSPRFSDVKNIVLELETTKNPTNFLQKTTMICFYLKTGGDLYMTPGNSRGGFNKIRVWSWELHLPQLPTFFSWRKKHIMSFWAPTKIWNKKKTPQNGGKNNPCGFSFRLWGPEKNMFLFRWLRGHSAAIRGMEAAAKSL